MVVTVVLAVAGVGFVVEGCRRFRQSRTLGVYLVLSGVVAIGVAVWY